MCPRGCLQEPAAPEASACSAAGIHWALEDLVASCLHHRQWHEVQARSKLAPSLFMPACLLHMKSVFVTGYALCLFATSCVYSDSQDCSCLRRAGSRPAPARSTRSRCLSQVMPCVISRLRVTFRGRGRGRGRGRAPPCVCPSPRTRPRTRTPAHMQCGGRFPDPRSTRQTDLTSQHAGHAARNFGAFQCHLAQSHVVQGLDALPPRVDVGLIEVTRGHRIGVEQRER